MSQSHTSSGSSAAEEVITDLNFERAQMTCNTTPLVQCKSVGKCTISSACESPGPQQRRLKAFELFLYCIYFMCRGEGEELCLLTSATRSTTASFSGAKSSLRGFEKCHSGADCGKHKVKTKLDTLVSCLSRFVSSI